MEPPILSQYSDSPVYEIGAMINLVHVRPQTLWGWAQHLGISGENRHDPTGNRRRYSERDLVALLWLRDMVIAGEAPQDAAVRLINAQRGVREGGYGPTGALGSGALASGALNMEAAWGTGAMNSGALPPTYGALDSAPTYDPQTFGGANGSWSSWPPTGGQGGVTYSNLGQGVSGLGATPTQPGRGALADPWRVEREWNAGVRNPAPDGRAANFSGPLRADPSTFGQSPQQGGNSGRLGSVYGATLEPPAYPARGVASQSLSSLRELRPLIPQLLQAFARFDTARANAILAEALRSQSVESVCVGLVQPAVARISELWSKSELTNPEERFALNFLRGFMQSVFYTTQEPMGAPFAIIGCAPNETSDFGAMLLAVLWRRAGVRVAYLGRGIDGDQLLQGRWPIPPTIFALTATSSQRIRALARIAKKVAELPAPQPVFAYWGPVFVRNPDLKRKVGGIYLGDDATTATQYVRRLLNLDGLDN